MGGGLLRDRRGRAATDAAAVQASSAAAYNVTKPLSQPAATKIATTIQATQTTLQTASPATVQAALPAACGAALETAYAPDAAPPAAKAAAASARIRLQLATTTPVNEGIFLGPKVAQVLAAVYATDPTNADNAAFLEEVALAESKTASTTRTFAWLTLIDAYELGRATIAYQLGYKSLSKLNLSHVTIGSLHAHGSGHLLTIKPTVLGARILRLLEIAGFSHKVTITLTLSETLNGHTKIVKRTVRVI
jgi:hypothetical protein